MTDKIEVPDGFVEWMKREIPPGTVISDPEWWASRIYREAAQPPLDTDSLAYKIGEIGNRIHNLSCERQNDEALSVRLSGISRELWDASQLAVRTADEELRRDAEQAEFYRFLRDNHVRTWVSKLKANEGAKTLDIDFEAEGHDLDDAIRAAIEAEKREG